MDNYNVCAVCKPMLLQKLREGVVPTGGAYGYGSVAVGIRSRLFLGSQIAAGAKSATGPGEYNAPHRIILGDLANSRFKGPNQGRIKRIKLVGPIQRHHGDPAYAAIE